MLRLVNAGDVILRNRRGVPRILRLLASVARPCLAVLIEGRAWRGRRASWPRFFALDTRLARTRRAVHMIPAGSAGRSLAHLGGWLAHVHFAHHLAMIIAAATAGPSEGGWRQRDETCRGK